MHSVYLVLGSNIDPEGNIPKALDQLGEDLQLLEISSAWRTVPVGTEGPHFVNLAAHVASDLGRTDLKTRILQKIENRLGRIRTSDKFAPRTVDIDIILFDGELIEKELASTAYLILPLSELLPDYVPPGTNRSLIQMAALDTIRCQAVRLDHFPRSLC